MDIKQYIICFALGAAFVSCSESQGADEPSAPLTMQFRTDTSLESRAYVPLDPVEYRVWGAAVYHDTEIGAASKYYLGAEPVKEFIYSSTTGTFAATDYFFPPSGTMDLIAFATNAGVKPTTTLLPSTLTSTGTMTSMKFDLRSPYQGTYEIAYSLRQTFDCNLSMTPPVMYFKRPQANLRFHFTAADQKTCELVEINYILIENVACKGLYTVNYSSGTGTWSNKTTENIKVANLVNKTMTFADGLDAGRGIYIIPQNTRSRIIVNYTMLNGADKTEKRYLNYVVEDVPGGAWEANYQYNYNIIVRGSCQMDIIDVEVVLVTDGSTGNMKI